MEQQLHKAICEAVALLNLSPESAKSLHFRQAHELLREVLVKYADYVMDLPVTTEEFLLTASSFNKG